MAAKTPTTLTALRAAPTTASYVTQTGNAINMDAVGVSIERDHRGCKELNFAFDDIDTGDTWTSGIKGVVDWRYHNDATTDTIRVAHSAGVFTFTTSAANQYVLLTLWVR